MNSLNNRLKNLSTIGLFLVLLFTSLFPWHSSSAQSQTTDQNWTTPVNLSHSGSTTNPSIVVDSNGIIHVVWEDTIAGEMYTSYDGTKWSTPVQASLPFNVPPSGSAAQPGSNRLRLIADGKGYIHAFWVDQNNQLHYSRVLGSQMGNGANWDSQQILANSAVDFDVSLDDQDRIHLAYVRAIDESGFPAGIYYRQSAANGASWGSPEVLYQSQYFRSLTNQNANVSIATDRNGTGQNIYVAWDNRPRKQVFFTRSTDGGNLWSDPAEIDKPDANNGFATPFNIRVAVNDQGTLLEWQVGDPAGSCTQNYQWSTDAGVSWGDRKQMLGELGVCPQDNQYFESDNGLILLVATIQTQIYFLAWNGSEWSDPQPQSELSGFQDPETFDQVILDCQNLTMGSNNRIYVVGCDSGNGKDIWLTNRFLGSTEAWYPAPSIWSNPETVTTSQQILRSPIIITDSKGNEHVFWTQVDDISSGSNQHVSLFYSRRDKDNWTSPVNITTSPNGDINQPSIVIDSTDTIYITWLVAQEGKIYFSEASADHAINPNDWSEPKQISPDRAFASSPVIYLDPFGEISIVYTIPINEQRGIYFTHSVDKGISWSPAVEVFNAAKAGWDRVGNPMITRGLNGQLHILWSKISMVDDRVAENIYYSTSLDVGKTWAEPDDVVDATINWSDILLTNNDVIQRLWIENRSGRLLFWYQTSQDGLNWLRPEGIPNLGEELESAAIIQDPSQKSYILQIAKDSFNNTLLHIWVWQDNGWSTFDTQLLSADSNITIDDVAAMISSVGKLDLIYNVSASNRQNESKNNEIIFMSRAVNVGPKVKLLTPTPEMTTSTPPMTSSIPLEATPTLALNNLQLPDVSTQQQNSLNGAIIGAGLASAIVLTVFIYGLLKIKK
jgi:hypothetical protein